MKALIISMKYSPAHVSLAIGYAKLLGDLGYNIFLHLNNKYKTLHDFSGIGTHINNDNIDENIIDVAIILNSAPKNFLLARQLKNMGAVVIYIFHEPHFGLRRKNEGYFERLKLFVSCCLSLLTVYSSTIIFLPSQTAMKMYKTNFMSYNKNIEYFPLLLDLDHKSDIAENRKCFSFLGAAVSVHNFDGYLKFIKYAYCQNEDFNYIIASRYDISDIIDSDQILQEMIRKGKLKVVHGIPISDNEMNNYFRDSFCVWNVYKDTTQSGVLPRAFMLGTPVIASKVGSFPEFVKQGVTGEFANENIATTLEYVRTIRDNITKYSRNCKKMFLDTFYYKNNVDRMKGILEKYDGWEHINK